MNVRLNTHDVVVVAIDDHDDDNDAVQLHVIRQKLKTDVSVGLATYSMLHCISVSCGQGYMSSSVEEIKQEVAEKDVTRRILKPFALWS